MWWAVFPSAWAKHADKLRRSAELLWIPLDHALILQAPFSQSDFELWDHVYAFLLVAGASLEAMFKAAAMQAEIKRRGLAGILKPNKTELQDWILTHDLSTLARRASIALSEIELAQLARFTKYVVWAGSYPVPKNLMEQRPNATITLDFQVSNFDKVWFDRLYPKAEESYRQHESEMPKPQ